MKRARATMIAAAILAATMGTARAADPVAGEAGRQAAEQVLARLDEHLAGVSSMRGRFVQTFVSAGLGVPQSESGRFALMRPDRMRWDYSRPETKTAVSDGVNTWLHVPEEGVVYRGSVEVWKRDSAFALLAGGKLAEAFDAAGTDAASALRRGDVVLRLTPRRKSQDLVEVQIEFDPRTYAIATVTGVDGMGNRISAVLSDIEENPRLAADLFVFTPPAGARVIDQDRAPEPR